jgi:glycosyltransferase involved in cell wall biosynthesis
VLPITGIVVTYNEDRRLRECLESLSFCDQLIVADLGSEDRSVEIAEAYADEVIHHERVPVVEKVRVNVVEQAKNDWVLFIDPDEICHPALARKARGLIGHSEESIGRVFLPWQFYFLGYRLKGTRWGGQSHKGVLAHRERCQFREDVFQGIQVKEGYQTAEISWEDPDHCIKHYWVDSLHQLFEKHWRYIKEEGSKRYNAGERFDGWVRWAWRVIFQFKYCYIDEDGWRDGVVGLFLSFFWAWFCAASELSLRNYQKSGEDTNR